MDMTAKQRLSYRGIFVPQTCGLAVSPQVFSIIYEGYQMKSERAYALNFASVYPGYIKRRRRRAA